MNALKRWNQRKLVEAWQSVLGNLSTQQQMDWPGGVGNEEQISVPEWAPLVDITEDDHEYLIKAELAEVKKEDVKVTADGGTLTIAGERRLEKLDKDKKHHRIERAYGKFERNFSLPDDANPTNVTAEYKNGVLIVHLPKTEKPKPQQIEVKVA